jgi:hypothetical protein
MEAKGCCGSVTDGDADFAVSGVNADREVDHPGNSVRLRDQTSRF